ncbi:hypothetical protein [Ornithinimicrobium cryptoxanthini]|uniref:ATP synthase protein I n=1 Tax=Ornithinimicrobium cryptoxanthini TaxID=2934161 RepID=A0ABY4YG12_9MICO|nr:hypothetical protein [Ornithinimicrobium cryptoxanthini]USQ75703.1 hypothetical protein NF557_13950 [Ornithinimicrobium cryptoxanthini]
MSASRSSRPRPRRAPGSVRRRMVIFALVPGLLVTLLSGVIAWSVRDGEAALSALIGGSLGVGIFLAGLLGITGVLAGPASASMAGAFALLSLQIIVGFAVLYALSRVDWVEMLPLGLGFLAAGLAFQVGVVLGYTGSRQLAFGELENDSGPGEMQ